MPDIKKKLYPNLVKARKVRNENAKATKIAKAKAKAETAKAAKKKSDNAKQEIMAAYYGYGGLPTFIDWGNGKFKDDKVKNDNLSTFYARVLPKAVDRSQLLELPSTLHLSIGSPAEALTLHEAKKIVRAELEAEFKDKHAIEVKEGET